MLDFSFGKLENLYSILEEQQYKIISFRKYLTGNRGRRFVILRHDIDRKIENALNVARLEHEAGIESSFYFQGCFL